MNVLILGCGNPARAVIMPIQLTAADENELRIIADFNFVMWFLVGNLGYKLWKACVKWGTRGGLLRNLVKRDAIELVDTINCLGDYL